MNQLETQQNTISRNSHLDNLKLKMMNTSGRLYKGSFTNESHLVEQLANQMQNYFEDQSAPIDDNMFDSISYDDDNESCDDDVCDEGTAVS